MLTRLSVRSALFVVVAAALLTLSACSVQVDDKKADGKKLDIQTPMGNLFADVVMQKGNPVFMMREKKNMDIIFR